jgi:hypothetical protein
MTREFIGNRIMIDGFKNLRPVAPSRRQAMAFKFKVGETVGYQDPRSKETVFTVIERRPGEDNASERRYKIKATGEGFERVVVECDLNSVYAESQNRNMISKKRLSK